MGVIIAMPTGVYPTSGGYERLPMDVIHHVPVSALRGSQRSGSEQERENL
jgi:hypothetical protein